MSTIKISKLEPIEAPYEREIIRLQKVIEEKDKEIERLKGLLSSVMTSLSVEAVSIEEEQKKDAEIERLTTVLNMGQK